MDNNIANIVQKKTIKALWPYNLIDQILGDPYTNTPYTSIVTSDQKHALEYVINNYLTPQEQKLVLARYRDCEKLATIGQCYNLTCERIRQIIAYAVRKLRHPSSKRIVELGYYGSRIEEEENELRARELALAQRRKNIEELEDLVRKREDQFRAKHPEIMDPIDRKAELAATEIKVLNLSARPYNALKAHMLYSIQDVLDYMENRNLNDIKGVGTKSAEDIRKKLHAYLIQM